MEIIIKAVSDDPPCASEGLVVAGEGLWCQLQAIKNAFAVSNNFWHCEAAEAEYKADRPKFGSSSIVNPDRRHTIPKGHK